MEASGLPNTFVSGRNLLLLTLAAALAYRRGIQVIVTGVCETYFSGYPVSDRNGWNESPVPSMPGSRTKVGLSIFCIPL